jgi:UDP-N-acetylmuramoyl-tripeptide--D-alanyl-D-alanine ligase
VTIKETIKRIPLIGIFARSVYIRRLCARFCRWRLHKLKVLAITGSCGKTSASQFLIQILSRSAVVHPGVGDNCENSIITNMRGLRDNHRYYVQEVSGHEPGALERSLSSLMHEVGIVTTVGLDHYRTFRTREAVAAEKSTMVELLPKNGVAVLNADDPYVAAMKSHTRARKLTYGLDANADLRATDIVSDWPQRFACTIHYQDESHRLETGLFGDLLLPSVLAAIGGARAVGVPLAESVAALQGVAPVTGRLSPHRSPQGMWMVFDFKGTYWTVEKVLDLARRAQAPRKTLVFGSFSDTRGASSHAYRKVAKEALKLVDRVVWAGERQSYVQKMMGPENEGHLFCFKEMKEAAEFLGSDPLEDELVIIKSNGMEHIERLILSQEHPLKCWKNKCSLKEMCYKCPHSGLIEESVEVMRD